MLVVVSSDKKWHMICGMMQTDCQPCCCCYKFIHLSY